MTDDQPGTYDKALRINVDAMMHGTFAEIGAGQEVARWFFHVGGAAATVAKSISAYDMAISDAVYGPTEQYVSRHRLRAMLDHEYALLRERLEPKRGSTTRFFVFADTVATRSYSRRQEGHGWMGVRFQDRPQAQPSEIVVHLRLLDTEAVREQEAIGIMGVNMVYGALYDHEDPTRLIRSLLDDVTRDRVDLDMIKLSGPCFAGLDQRLLSLKLVEQARTDAVMFSAGGEIVQPAEILHHKRVLMVRGSFRPITNPTLDMLQRAEAACRREDPGAADPPVVITEMSLGNLLSGNRIEHADFLARADVLGALGRTVMISSYGPYYAMVAFLRRYTSRPVTFALGVPNLLELFDERHYHDLGGGVLESLGRLFQAGVRLCVYPYRDPRSSETVTAATCRVPPHLAHLHAHLIENGLIVPLDGVDERQLHILPREVLAQIQRGDPGWETVVPESAVQVIREKGLFGYRPTAPIP
jgi:hypothetical protein